MTDNLLPSKKTKEYYIDILKGVAMLAVILVHFNNGWHSPNSLLNKVSAIGARCPQLFFIISAYLTWASLDRHPVKFTSFLKKRYSRMAPLFYVAVIVAVLIPSFRVFDISIGNYFSHALFINGLNPLWYNSIIGVEWYVADLALFYILTVILRKIIIGLKSGVVFFGLSVIISSASLILSNRIFAEQIVSDSRYETYFHTGLILHQLPIMTIGVIIYYVVKKMRVGQLNCWKVLIESVAVTAIFAVGFIVLHMNKKYMTSSLIAGMMFGCLFLFCGCIKEELWKKKVFAPLEYIGKHSFGIYCFHQIVINCVFQLSLNKDSLLLWFATFVLIATISCGVGIGSELIESWCLSSLRKIVPVANGR